MILPITVKQIPFPLYIAFLRHNMFSSTLKNQSFFTGSRKAFLSLHIELLGMKEE